MAKTQEKLTKLAVQESESMAMIARITMLFLPGTFVTVSLPMSLVLDVDLIFDRVSLVATSSWVQTITEQTIRWSYHRKSGYCQ